MATSDHATQQSMPTTQRTQSKRATWRVPVACSHCARLILMEVGVALPNEHQPSSPTEAAPAPRSKPSISLNQARRLPLAQAQQRSSCQSKEQRSTNASQVAHEPSASKSEASSPQATATPVPSHRPSGVFSSYMIANPTALRQRTQTL